nr:sensory neurons membrane protein [Semanotus bifasciatus]
MVRKNFCTIKVLLITTLALLVVFIGVLIVSFVGMPLLIGDQIDKSVQLEKGTIQWDRFVNTPFGLDFKVWLFNVTNPDDILNGETPVLKEIGPYHYVETRQKDVISTNDKEDTVKYEQYVFLNFSESLSGDLTEDDEIVLLNPVLLSMAQLTTTIERMVLGGCLDKIFPAEYNSLFIKINVKKVLFEGFEFAFNNADVGVACNIVRNKVIEKTAAIRNVETIRNGEDPSEITSLKFSLLNYKVSNSEGVYDVFRGLADVSKLGSILRWDHSTNLTNWGRLESINNETCNKVRGTDSTIYAPGVTRDQSLEIFSTDICRIVQIEYEGEGTYKGISGYRFVTPKNTLWSSTDSPENDCFCTKQTSNEEGELSCFLDGVIDLMPCVGAPILLSFPHFLYADEKYINAISGVEEADESIHQIYLLVEPNTGTPLEGKRRVQLNAVLRQASFLKITESLPKAVIPLLWVEEGASLPQEYIDELNDKLFNMLKLADGVRYGLIAVTLASVLVSTGFLIRKQFFTG